MNALLPAAAVALLLAAPLTAQEIPGATEQERRTPVPSAPARPYRIAPVSRAKLANGLKLAAVQSARLPVVALELALPFGGSAFDPQGREGLASLVSELLMEGSGTRNADGFADAVAQHGASISVTASSDALLVSVYARRESLDKVLALVSDLVRRPALPQASLDRLRGEMLANLAAARGEPGGLAQKRLNALLYPNHPYGRSADEASVSALTRTDAAAAVARASDPRGAVLTSAGGLSIEELRGYAQRHFGSWKGTGALPELPPTLSPIAGTAVSAPQAAPGLAIELIDLPGSGQSAMRLGQLSITRDHPDYFAVRVMLEVLGGGQGRLFRNIRESKGWAYGAYASLGVSRSAGAIGIVTDVETGRTADALREIIGELDRLRREPVPEEELLASKRYANGRFLRRQATTEGVAAQTVSDELSGLPADEASRYRERIMAVTAADVLDAARRHLRPESLSIAISGDAQKIYEDLARIAPVRVFTPDGKPKPAPSKPASNS